MTVRIKDPDASLDYGVDWSDYLGEGEVLTESTWSVTPPDGLVIAGESATDTIAGVIVSGGVRGDIYRLVNRVTTTAARVDERSIIIRVEHR